VARRLLRQSNVLDVSALVPGRSPSCLSLGPHGRKAWWLPKTASVEQLCRYLLRAAVCEDRLELPPEELACRRLVLGYRCELQPRSTGD
jgi:hypothetical protein